MGGSPSIGLFDVGRHGSTALRQRKSQGAAAGCCGDFCVISSPLVELLLLEGEGNDRPSDGDGYLAEGLRPCVWCDVTRPRLRKNVSFALVPGSFLLKSRAEAKADTKVGKKETYRGDIDIKGLADELEDGRTRCCQEPSGLSCALASTARTQSRLPPPPQICLSLPPSLTASKRGWWY